jgi:thioredoxin-like negative regulator of GroEL
MAYCVVYIGATWCKPCKEIKPVIEQLTAQFQIPLEIKDYDTDLSEDEQAEIKKVPTVRVFQIGRIVMEWNMNQVASLKEWLTTHIAIGGTDDF